MEEIVAGVKNKNNSTIISEEISVKQPTAHSSPAHSSPAHSSTAHSSPARRSPAKQPPAKFKTPALAQALASLVLHREDTHGQHGPAAGGDAEKVHTSGKPRTEDQQVLDRTKELAVESRTLETMPPPPSRTSRIILTRWLRGTSLRSSTIGGRTLTTTTLNTRIIIIIENKHAESKKIAVKENKFDEVFARDKSEELDVQKQNADDEDTRQPHHHPQEQPQQV
jgi:hypothetical protein